MLSTIVAGGRRLVLQRLVQPPVIVKAEIVGQGASGVARAVVLFQVHLFVLDRAPEALGEDVIQGSTAAIHTDLDAGVREQLGVLRAGEMAALVAIPDQRLGLAQSLLHGSQHERHFQRLVQLPANHVARIPVQHGHQVQPTGTQPNVSNIDAPDVVGIDITYIRLRAGWLYLVAVLDWYFAT